MGLMLEDLDAVPSLHLLAVNLVRPLTNSSKNQFMGKMFIIIFIQTTHEISRQIK